MTEQTDTKCNQETEIHLLRQRFHKDIADVIVAGVMKGDNTRFSGWLLFYRCGDGSFWLCPPIRPHSYFMKWMSCQHNYNRHCWRWASTTTLGGLLSLVIMNGLYTCYTWFQLTQLTRCTWKNNKHSCIYVNLIYFNCT